MLPLESEVQKFYGRRRSDLILGREAHEQLYSPPAQCDQPVDNRTFDKHFAKACGTINDTKLVGSIVTVSDLKLGSTAEWVSILTSQPADRAQALKSAEQAPGQFELVVKRSPQSTTGNLQIELMPVASKSPTLNPAQAVESGAAVVRATAASLPDSLEVTPLLATTNPTSRANDVEALPPAVRNGGRILVIAESVLELNVLPKGSTASGAAATSSDRSAAKQSSTSESSPLRDRIQEVPGTPSSSGPSKGQIEALPIAIKAITTAANIKVESAVAESIVLTTKDRAAVTTGPPVVALVRTSASPQDVGPSQIGIPVTFIPAELLPSKVRAAFVNQSADLVAQPPRVQSAAGDLMAQSPRMVQSAAGDLAGQSPRVQSAAGDLAGQSPPGQSAAGDLAGQSPRGQNSSSGPSSGAIEALPAAIKALVTPANIKAEPAGAESISITTKNNAAITSGAPDVAHVRTSAPSQDAGPSQIGIPVTFIPAELLPSKVRAAIVNQSADVVAQPPHVQGSSGDLVAQLPRAQSASGDLVAQSPRMVQSTDVLPVVEMPNAKPASPKQPQEQPSLMKVSPGSEGANALRSAAAGFISAAVQAPSIESKPTVSPAERDQSNTLPGRQSDPSPARQADLIRISPVLASNIAGAAAIGTGTDRQLDQTTKDTTITSSGKSAVNPQAVADSRLPSGSPHGSDVASMPTANLTTARPELARIAESVSSTYGPSQLASGASTMSQAERTIPSGAQTKADVPFNITTLPDASGFLRALDGSRANNSPIGQPADAPRAANPSGGQPADTPRASNLPSVQPADTTRAANSSGGQLADTLRASNLPGGQPSDMLRASNLPGGQPADTTRASNLPSVQPADTPRFSSATSGQMVDALATNSLVSHLTESRLNTPPAQLADGLLKPQTAMDSRLEPADRKPARETEFTRLANIANGPMDISLKPTHSPTPSDGIVTPIKQSLQMADSAMPTAPVAREIQSGRENLSVKDGLSAHGATKEFIVATAAKEFNATTKESTNATAKELNATTKESSPSYKELIATSTTKDGGVNATVKEPGIGTTGSKEPSPVGSNATIKDAAVVSFNQEDGRRQLIQQDASAEPKASTKNGGVLPTGNDTSTNAGSTNTAATKPGSDSASGTGNQIATGLPGITKDFNGSYDNKNQVREGQTPADINQVKAGKQPIISGDGAGIDPSAAIRSASDNRIIGSKSDSISTDGRGTLPQDGRNPLQNEPRVPKTDEKDLGPNGKLDDSHNSKNIPVVIIPERTAEPLVKPADRINKQNPFDTRVTQQRGHQRRLPYLVKAGDTIEFIAEKLFKERRFATLILTINRANIRFVDNGGKMLPQLTAGQILWMPTQKERETYATKVLGRRSKVPQVNIFDEIADMIERRTKAVKLEPIRMPEVTIMYPAPSNSSAPSHATTSGEQQAYKLPTLSQVVRKIQLTSRRSITLSELDGVQGQVQLMDRLTSAVIENPGSPAGGCDRSPKSPQTQQPIEPLNPKHEARLIIDRLAETCRVVTSNQSADQSDFNSVLQLALGGEWKTIASYEVRKGQAYRYSFKHNGNIQPFAMDLPLIVVTQMAREDFTRNWAAYCSEFHQQRADR